MTSKTRRLGARQLRFVEEYMVDLNATRAAIAAGYTKKSASAAGWEVLRNPKVATEISRRQRQLSQRLEVSAENVISELAKIGFANLGDFFSVSPEGDLVIDKSALGDPMKSAALSQLEVTEDKEGRQTIKLKVADKRAALNDLGRHLQLFQQSPTFTSTTATDEGYSIRQLALATLALLRQASTESPEPGEDSAEPMQIEYEPASAEEDFLRDVV